MNPTLHPISFLLKSQFSPVLASYSPFSCYSPMVGCIPRNPIWLPASTEVIMNAAPLGQVGQTFQQTQQQSQGQVTELPGAAMGMDAGSKRGHSPGISGIFGTRGTYGTCKRDFPSRLSASGEHWWLRLEW